METVKVFITDDEDRHEGSAGYRDGGGQGRHPELKEGKVKKTKGRKKTFNKRIG